MREFFRRMSYFTTLVIPIGVALVIAFVGLAKPEWPRIYFIVGYLAALILLPGITLGLKLGSTPLVEEEVEFVGVFAPGWIEVRRATGEICRYHHRQLYELFQSGGIRRGERLILRFLDQDIVGWRTAEEEQPPKQTK